MRQHLLSLFVIMASAGYVLDHRAATGPDISVALAAPDPAPRPAPPADMAAPPADVPKVKTALPAPTADAAAAPSPAGSTSPVQQPFPPVVDAAPPVEAVMAAASADTPTAVSVTDLEPAAERDPQPAPAPAGSPLPAMADIPVPTPRPDYPVAAQAAPAMPPAPQPQPAPARIARTDPKPAGRYNDGTYRGSVADAYYGRLQVEAVIRDGRLAQVRILRYPNDRRTSRHISGRALPRLEREAIAAQSARVDTVSGATLVSRAYRRSLGTALRHAHA